MLDEDWISTRTILIRDTSPSSDRLRYFVAVDWKWKGAPVARMSDKIAVGWTDDFQAEQNSLHNLTQFSGFYQWEPFNHVRHNYIPSDQLPKAGFAFQFPLQLGPLAHQEGVNVSWRGYASGIVYKLKADLSPPYTATVVSKYFHKQICPMDGAIGFGKEGPSIGISFAPCYDETRQPGIFEVPRY